MPVLWRQSVLHRAGREREDKRMIIDFTTDSLHYEQVTERKQYIHYQCPVCRQKNTLKRHGFYKRNLVLWLEQKEEKLLSILRVRCTNCRCTHAVLPRDAVPYKVYSISFYVKMLRIIYQFGKQISLCIRILDTCPVQIYGILHKITQKFRKQNNNICEQFWESLPKKKYFVKKYRQVLTYTTWIVNSQTV